MEQIVEEQLKLFEEDAVVAEQILNRRIETKEQCEKHRDFLQLLKDVAAQENIIIQSDNCFSLNRNMGGQSAKDLDLNIELLKSAEDYLQRTQNTVLICKKVLENLKK